MKLKIPLCLAVVLNLFSSCVALPKQTAQETEIGAQRRELRALLLKASPNSPPTHLPEMPGGWANEYSRYLTESENQEALKLLSVPEVTKEMPRDLLLSALKRRELDGDAFGQFGVWLESTVARYWAHDPVVGEFYREGLAKRGDQTIAGLDVISDSFWDDSLLEPIVRFIEKDASDAGLPGSKVSWIHWIAIDDALMILERHQSIWRTNQSVPPRLSKAVLMVFPSVQNASMPGPQPGEQMWCNAVRMLGETHDTAMIQVLRPFLKEKVVAGDGAIWMPGYQPLRACDEVASAIRGLIGEQKPEDYGHAMSGGFWAKPGVTYPKWIEWDKEIAELEGRLDALPKK